MYARYPHNGGRLVVGQCEEKSSFVMMRYYHRRCHLKALVAIQLDKIL